MANLFKIKKIEKWQIYFYIDNDLVDSDMLLDMPIPRIGESVIIDVEYLVINVVYNSRQHPMPTVSVYLHVNEP